MSILTLFVSGCTMIGIDHPTMRKAIDFGPPQTVNFCVYLDKGVTPSDANRLLASWNETEADKYQLYINPMAYDLKVREGFTRGSIDLEMAQMSLHGKCDRAIWFVNRTPADYAYGTALTMAALTGVPIPEILGETDDPTLTRVYVYTKADSFNGVILRPWRVTRHELYHALGCAKHYDMPDCYERIRTLKARRDHLVAEQYFAGIGEPPFYPTFKDGSYETLDSRKDVDQHLSSAIAR
jgi:hypothetical protein